ncbi:unnamed protein product [Cylicocyclus nassatus]|uniref:Cystatin domain-containing protein n=1 Tax=Cylicocyclus nassatus TaxID=53992 RepID=A0AA36DIA3_CYLNA|nr:unnamed protein product [Cylicocyclus nassatus]
MQKAISADTMSSLIFVLTLLCTVVSTQMLAGGKKEQDPSRPEYMAMAWKASTTLNENSAANDSPYAMMPIKVLKASTQVVSGIIYEFEILFGEAGCKKGEVDLATLQAANCQLRNGGNRAIYKVNCIERPWQNYLKINVSKIRDVSADEAL